MLRSAGIALLLLLSACSPAQPVERSVDTRTVASSCEMTSVLPIVAAQVDKSTIITVPWDPAPGTELAEVLNGGGLVCAFGNESTELGATVMWLDDATTIFQDHESGWSDEGFTEVTIAGADKAWFLFSEGEITQWRVNVLVGDVWIQVRSSIDRTFDDGRDLVLSAIDSLQA